MRYIVLYRTKISAIIGFLCQADAEVVLVVQAEEEAACKK